MDSHKIQQSKEDSKEVPSFDVETIRKDFPILNTRRGDYPLIYFDNAATAQKPRQVIDALSHYYTQTNANVHRGVHFLSNEATEAYGQARKTVARFLHAANTGEIVFVRGATEGINLVAHAFGEKFINKGDTIILSEMEHHSNIVPWQWICQKTEATLRVIPMREDGTLDLETLPQMLNEHTRLLAITHASNALGTIVPVKKIIRMAHEANVPVLVDAAQSVPHVSVDVQDLNCDFLVFSGHKVFGPTGIGVLYGKKEWLEKMPAYQGGGGMISSVHFDHITLRDIPEKFESGTPNIAGAIGLAQALEYLHTLGLANIEAYERELTDYMQEALSQVKDIHIQGTAKDKLPVFSFLLGDVHSHDLGTFLDTRGIAVRTGHHCAQPIMRYYQVASTTRASLSFYNTKEEIDILCDQLHQAYQFFQQ